MSPPPGERLLKYVGDRATFALEGAPAGTKGFLRTTLGRAFQLHQEIIYEQRVRVAAHYDQRPTEPKPGHPAGLCWRDVPMEWRNGRLEVELTLPEVGFFNAKPFYVDARGRQVWPHGQDVGIAVHPNAYRTGNTIYCAFTRMFGETKTALATVSDMDPHLARLDKLGYTVIPASGKLRDLKKELPHIVDTLGCGILHLLPITPTPTTYARFGRFGSPYAVQDLTAVDPALVEFDRRTTGIDQFQELAYAMHARSGRVFLDIVINHTGWGSTLQENHPEWFLRNPNGVFESPGAWGTIWEDLVELDHRIPISWDYLAQVFLIWCSRGVDGFRCDAGYKVPTPAWRYIIARVRQEFPDTLFLLEGLGGAWEATEELLTIGGMQWAYSELFQNYDGLTVTSYLDHCITKSARVGTLVHYSETHDNDRLAKKGRTWSLMRNQLCALTSSSGAFGFTCGVEWLASEKLNVHSSRGMAWGNPENVVEEISRLSGLLRDHPCFFDGAELKRLSPPDSPVYVLERVSADGQDRIIVLVNLDDEEPQSFRVDRKLYQVWGEPRVDLLAPGGKPVAPKRKDQEVEFQLAAGAAICLAASREPKGVLGQRYTVMRAQVAFAVQALATILEPEEIGPFDWAELARLVEAGPKAFLGAIPQLDRAAAKSNLLAALEAAVRSRPIPQVVSWSLPDLKRITPIPPDHWILIEDRFQFRGAVFWAQKPGEQFASTKIGEKFYAAVPPLTASRERRIGPAKLDLERYGEDAQPNIEAELLFLSESATYSPRLPMPIHPKGGHINAPMVLFTNGLGGMARMCVDLGAVKSKYDCVLGANLHPSLPVDRHVFVKRIRIWINANGFISALDRKNLVEFTAGQPATWRFSAAAGDGRTVLVEMKAGMLSLSNTTAFQFELLESVPGKRSGPHDAEVRLTVRLDLEDRNFHSQTERNPGAEFHFFSNCRALKQQVGFEFKPAPDRQLRAIASEGAYNHEPEWSHSLPHALEQTRGHVGAGDAYSPGWFDLPLKARRPVALFATAEETDPSPENIASLWSREHDIAQSEDSFGEQLALAARAYVVRRDEFKTVIAGYPWFLDWGRDTLICGRGLISAGMLDEVRDLLITFGRFEKNGTLPNTIHGADASNRDTSDAPLWFGIVVEELAAEVGPEIYSVVVDEKGRTILDVLRGLATGYSRGTPNGIQLDHDSGLIWSPAHFTWMDTNYPTGTPREGYPIEIQALWARLLRQLERMNVPGPWRELAERALASIEKYFWLEQKGWFSDCLFARPNVSAAHAVADDSLRSNCLFLVTLGLVSGERAKLVVDQALKWLVVPGGLRTLAPLPVEAPLHIYSSDWRLLNDPQNPYWGKYFGDEDTQRKPAYHNGTAWTWTFPAFCEALARAWEFSPEALSAARAYLGSLEHLLSSGCLGQIPEILDGDAPHQPRGCDAQAWGVTEALRVWQLLKNPTKK